MSGVSGGIRGAHLGSSSGMWVNGWRVRGRRAVEPGDAVRLGDADWVFAPRP